MSLRVTIRGGEPMDFENGIYVLAPFEGHMSVVIGKRIGAKSEEIFSPLAFIPTMLVVRADVIPEPPLALAPPLPFAEVKK